MVNPANITDLSEVHTKFFFLMRSQSSFTEFSYRIGRRDHPKKNKNPEKVAKYWKFLVRDRSYKKILVPKFLEQYGRNAYRPKSGREVWRLISYNLTVQSNNGFNTVRK